MRMIAHVIGKAALPSGITEVEKQFPQASSGDPFLGQQAAEQCVELVLAASFVIKLT